jgi:hypothetical protein
MPRPRYLQERATRAHWIEGWVDPRVGLDDMGKCTLTALSSTGFPRVLATQQDIFGFSVF